MIKEFKNKLFEKALQEGFQNGEICFMKTSSFEAKIFHGEVEQYKNATSMGISFRGIYNGKMGYSYSEKIDDSVINILIKNAKENSEIIEDAEMEVLFAGSPKYPEIEKSHTMDLSVEEKINKAKIMEKAAYEADRRVESVDYCVILDGNSNTYIANTLGLDLSHESSFAAAYAYVRACENGQTKMNWDIYKYRDFSLFKPEDVAKKAVEKAVSSLGAESVKSEKYSIVIENAASCDLLSQFVSVFFARNVQKGFSLLKDKLNKKIAGNVLTIYDDAIHKDSLGNMPFDSEGVATRNKTVIEKGVLKTYLYNLKTAAIDGVQSTGNGFRCSYKSAIETACINFYIEPSNISINEILIKMNAGILITDLSGLHAGVNSISGDFSLLADGFLIENGKISKPVEQITVAGNFYNMLNDILEVAEDLYFDMPSSKGTIGSPSIYINSLDVSGI